MFFWILLGSLVVASISVLYLIANVNSEDPCNINDSDKKYWEKSVCKYGPPLIAFTACITIILLLLYFITDIIMDKARSAGRTVRSAAGKTVRSAGSVAGRTVSAVKGKSYTVTGDT